VNESGRSQTGDSIRILIDRAEMHSGVVDLLAEFDDVDIEIAALPRGDYWIGGNIAVERKTVSDLIASVNEDRKRLFNQVRGIKDMGMRPLFVIEGGSLYDPLSDISESIIAEALSYLAIIEAVTVLRAGNACDTAQLLYVMARHAQRGQGYRAPLRGRLSAGDSATAQQYLVEGLPGIGPRLARALLDHFGTVRSLFLADEER
jgi:fanconi anemia group M protein